MIKIYGMATCPDCTYVEEQAAGNDRYELIDIGTHVRRLKEFLRLRDTAPAMAAVRRAGTVGIPCFVLDDGTVTLRAEDAGLRAEDAGLRPRPRDAEGAACSLDGSGC